VVYCPECGAVLEVITFDCYRCPKCGRRYVVHLDPQNGEVLVVTALLSNITGNKD